MGFNSNLKNGTKTGGRSILRAVDRYYDHDLEYRANEWLEGVQEYLDEIRGEVIKKHKEEIEQLLSEYEGIRAEIEGKTGDFTDRFQSLWHGIKDELRQKIPDRRYIDRPPEGEPGEEIPDPLLDTSRDYLEQMAAYKTFKGKGLKDDTEYGDRKSGNDHLG